jgi:hypothetical protein
MEDEEFLARTKEKIERLAGREIELTLDQESENPVALDITAPVPRVVLAASVLEYPGLVRMAVEYVVACIRKERTLEPLEFQLLLRRN